MPIGVVVLTYDIQHLGSQKILQTYLGIVSHHHRLTYLTSQYKQ